MSTWCFFRTSSRCADVIARNWTRPSGEPKIARAISLTMSMSKPSRLPEVGLRKPNR